MGATTLIAWCDATFNPWIGCQRISEACKNCYAAVSTPARTNRAKGLELWGPPATTARKRTSEANWKLPLRWNREAKASGVRRRVFCASLADVFEAHADLDAMRADLWKLVEACDALDWLLLTKRPENIRAMVPPAWLVAWPAHVWVGCTVENQARAAERIPHLLSVPAAVRFLSCEPLGEALSLREEWLLGAFEQCPDETQGDDDECRGCPGFYRPGGDYCGAVRGPRISWVIVGGESGDRARPFDLAWARKLRDQCRDAGVAFFMKQLGARPVDSSRAAIHQPCIHNGKPAIRTTIHAADAPEVAQARVEERDESLRLARPQVQHPLYLREHFRLDDRAGADPSEWPADLRVQQFPNGDRS